MLVGEGGLLVDVGIACGREQLKTKMRGRPRREGGKIEAFGAGPWHFHWGSVTYTQSRGLWEKKRGSVRQWRMVRRITSGG